MEHVIIRDFCPGDMERILDYREESGRISFPGLAIDRGKERELISDHLRKHPGTLKVAEAAGRVVGYIRFHVKESSFGDYAIIDAIFVEGGYRKSGIGKLLQQAAEERLASLGIGLVEATVTNTNAPSMDFFRSGGYEEKRTVLEKRLEKAG